MAKDLDSYQTRQEQREKSKGDVQRLPNSPHTAAETHALLRARSRFDIKEMVSEYRALRASVLARWIGAQAAIGADFDDMMRFNEAIDQALAESAACFHEESTESRNLFLPRCAGA